METITLKKIHEDLDFIKKEILTIKGWLNDDAKLSPSERGLVDETIRKARKGDFTDMITLEDLKKKMGV
ncbi:MAG TPA: hypothetical protein VJB08_06415 [Candidatus Nanoarchaeia archaeon]|nr:hypothetical protein [Candidatus Nanoarchaeia archaeon]